MRAPLIALTLTPILTAGCDGVRSYDGGFFSHRDGGTFVEPPIDDGGVARIPVDFGPVSESLTPPVPISGGTLLALSDGKTVVASDPDRDRVWIADLDARTAVPIALTSGAEPGRAAQDGNGRVHVLTRRGGQVVTIDPSTQQIIDTRDVCAAPRGIAYDPASDSLQIACQSGLLITMPAGGGVATRTVKLLPDLRDVVVEGSHIWVSRFRSAQILRVADDATYETIALSSDSPNFQPNVAWRMIADPVKGGVIVLHQLASTDIVQVEPMTTNTGAYGSAFLDACDSPMVRTAVSTVRSWGVESTHALSTAMLGVDIALSTGGTKLGVAAPGNAGSSAGSLRYPLDASSASFTGCLFPEYVDAFDSNETIAVALIGDGIEVPRQIVQLREPAAIADERGRIPLTLDTDTSLAHIGHALFHRNAGANIACASCHPEGSDDGKVWRFSGLGERRTQTLRTGIAGTEPFHWDGDMSSFTVLANEVFSHRMNGPELDTHQLRIFQRWIESISPWPTDITDPDAAARGKTLFESPEVGCLSCHVGPQMTNSTTVNVGTGGMYQVPSLIGVGLRTPIMHNGCASRIRDRFEATCGGGDAHGHTSQLTAFDLRDLSAYLESL